MTYGDKPRAAACGCEPWDAYDLHSSKCKYAEAVAEIDRLRVENQHLNERLGEAEINVKGAEFGEGQAMAEVDGLRVEAANWEKQFYNAARVLTVAKDALRAPTAWQCACAVNRMADKALKEIEECGNESCR